MTDSPADLGGQGRYNETGLILVADVTPPAPVADLAAGEALKEPKLTGMDYVQQSWANVLSLSSKDPTLASRIRELPNRDAIRDCLGTAGSSGSWGYINNNSGWANAAASMAWLFNKAQETGRVSFVAGTVVSLVHDETAVTGAKLSDGRVLSAELVVVAAGAWTGSLVDLAGQTMATGQVMGYLDLTEAEQEKLGKMPIILNLSNGLFIIPPTNRVLKIARHASGYVNPTTLHTPPLPLSPQSAGPSISAPASLPLTHLDHPNLSIPAEGADDLRRALHEMIPWPELKDRPFTKTRLCWYSDTPTGDFLIDYHPGWRGLFVATGDSGHAFKFLPVVGEKIADCIMHNCPPEFRGKWAWRKTTGLPVATDDGTRGGTALLVLADELAKTAEAIRIPARD
jgi:sarcosine oxidase/L-pipecolate oxidase